MVPVSPFQIGPYTVGHGRAPFLLIAGPCAIEGRDAAFEAARGVVAAARGAGVPVVFKASFDKANRSSWSAYRGPGLEAGLEILQEIREALGVPVTTDLHLPEQAPAVGEAVDLIQIPAFLSRQTDLLAAAAATGKPVNVKKGQFLAPWEMANVVDKLRRFGAAGIALTERGASFGYNNLVVDMRSLAIMRGLGVPVCIDATHAIQLPGGQGSSSGGQREYAPVIARAAVAVGVDMVFMETHPDPDAALSDGANMIPLGELEGLLQRLARFDRALKEESDE